MSDSIKISSLGNGPELVLLHGWALHSGIWGGLVDALATEYRVNLVDLPGHGFNCHVPLSRNLDTVADQILSELPPAIWMGWSLGGLVALSAALQQPQKIEKMILVAATPSFCKREGWDCGVDNTAQHSFTDGLENNFEETLDYFCLQTFGENQVGEALHRLGVSSFAEAVPARQVLHNGLHLLYSNNLLPGLINCKIPTLFLGGTRDRTISPESLRQATSLMPDARLGLIPGASHAPFISHEEKFLDIIRGFLPGITLKEY